jgi:hypothetical protein
MLALGVEEQADKPLITQANVIKRIRLNDWINAEMVFMECLGWI